MELKGCIIQAVQCYIQFPQSSWSCVSFRWRLHYYLPCYLFPLEESRFHVTGNYSPSLGSSHCQHQLYVDLVYGGAVADDLLLLLISSCNQPSSKLRIPP